LIVSQGRCRIKVENGDLLAIARILPGKDVSDLFSVG
jgi:hypothetical protein